MGKNQLKWIWVDPARSSYYAKLPFGGFAYIHRVGKEKWKTEVPGFGVSVPFSRRKDAIVDVEIKVETLTKIKKLKG